nr:hypothetical protein [Propionibacterium acidifaciens]
MAHEAVVDHLLTVHARRHGPAQGRVARRRVADLLALDLERAGCLARQRDGAIAEGGQAPQGEAVDRLARQTGVDAGQVDLTGLGRGDGRRPAQQGAS